MSSRGDINSFLKSPGRPARAPARAGRIGPDQRGRHRFRLAGVLAQEVERALARQPCARLVVARARVAVEAVPGGIDVHRDLWMGGGDAVPVLLRDRRIGVAEVEQHRAAGPLAGEVGDGAAVVADRRGELSDRSARLTWC